MKNGLADAGGQKADQTFQVFKNLGGFRKYRQQIVDPCFVSAEYGQDPFLIETTDFFPIMPEKGLLRISTTFGKLHPKIGEVPENHLLEAGSRWLATCSFARPMPIRPYLVVDRNSPNLYFAAVNKPMEIGPKI